MQLAPGIGHLFTCDCSTLMPGSERPPHWAPRCRFSATAVCGAPVTYASSYVGHHLHHLHDRSRQPKQSTYTAPQLATIATTHPFVIARHHNAVAPDHHNNAPFQCALRSPFRDRHHLFRPTTLVRPCVTLGLVLQIIAMANSWPAEIAFQTLASRGQNTRKSLVTASEFVGYNSLARASTKGSRSCLGWPSTLGPPSHCPITSSHSITAPLRCDTHLSASRTKTTMNRLLYRSLTNLPGSFSPATSALCTAASSHLTAPATPNKCSIFHCAWTHAGSPVPGPTPPTVAAPSGAAPSPTGPTPPTVAAPSGAAPSPTWPPTTASAPSGPVAIPSAAAPPIAAAPGVWILKPRPRPPPPTIHSFPLPTVPLTASKSSAAIRPPRPRLLSHSRCNHPPLRALRRTRS